MEFTYNEPADVLFNTPQRKGFEQLLRKLLQLPSQPAVVMLHHYAWWFNQGDGASYGLFYRPAENQLGVFGEVSGSIPGATQQRAQRVECPPSSSVWPANNVPLGLLLLLAVL